MMYPPEIQRLRDMYVDKVPCATPRMRYEGWLREGRENEMPIAAALFSDTGECRYWMVDDGGAGRLKQQTWLHGPVPCWLLSQVSHSLSESWAWVCAGGLNPSRLKAGSPSGWTTARGLVDAREAWDHNPAFALTGWDRKRKTMSMEAVSVTVSVGWC